MLARMRLMFADLLRSTIPPSRLALGRGPGAGFVTSNFLVKEVTDTIHALDVAVEAPLTPEGDAAFLSAPQATQAWSKLIARVIGVSVSELVHGALSPA